MADAPDHLLVIEKPGRSGAESVTAACVCKAWSRTCIIETQPGVFDVAASEARARASWTDHDAEIPELRRQAAAWQRRELQLQQLREKPIPLRKTARPEGVLADA
jgi:hypothetical protein